MMEYTKFNNVKIQMFDTFTNHLQEIQMQEASYVPTHCMKYMVNEQLQPLVFCQGMGFWEQIDFGLFM